MLAPVGVPPGPGRDCWPGCLGPEVWSSYACPLPAWPAVPSCPPEEVGPPPPVPCPASPPGLVPPGAIAPGRVAVLVGPLEGRAWRLGTPPCCPGPWLGPGLGPCGRGPCCAPRGRAPPGGAERRVAEPSSAWLVGARAGGTSARSVVVLAGSVLPGTPVAPGATAAAASPTPPRSLPSCPRPGAGWPCSRVGPLGLGPCSAPAPAASVRSSVRSSAWGSCVPSCRPSSSPLASPRSGGPSPGGIAPGRSGAGCAAGARAVDGASCSEGAVARRGASVLARPEPTTTGPLPAPVPLPGVVVTSAPSRRGSPVGPGRACPVTPVPAGTSGRPAGCMRPWSSPGSRPLLGVTGRRVPFPAPLPAGDPFPLGVAPAGVGPT